MTKNDIYKREVKRYHNKMLWINLFLINFSRCKDYIERTIKRLFLIYQQKNVNLSESETV
jgi:hypothetical protein